MSAQSPPVPGEELIRELNELREAMLEMAATCAPLYEGLPEGRRASMENLLHYLALRQRDIRPLQHRLAELGLSSLGRAESHVLASINALLSVLHRLATTSSPPLPATELGFASGPALLDQNTDLLFGQRPGSRRVRVMVTMPSEAAEDYLLVRDLVDAGMNCMRINCAHDGPEAWERMVENLRRARRELGRKCRVLMDLGGPKLRTGPLEVCHQVMRVRPKRDEYGRVTEPARIWLVPIGTQKPDDERADSCLPLPEEWLIRLHTGDSVEFRDTRDARRTLRIVGESGLCCLAESDKTCYVAAGTELVIAGKGKKRKGKHTARVGELSSTDSFIQLRTGDTLHLTRDMAPGQGAVYDSHGRLVSPASVGCSLPEVFADVRPGERIWLDDGMIGGIIRSVNADRIVVEITLTRPGGAKLRAEKGINLPDSRLSLSALTAKDLEDLRFVVRHAHMVGMSFIQDVADIYALQAELDRLEAPNLGVVLKIETRRGFEMLPDLLLAAMRRPAVGVMIARGDLAVECGYERLSEVQEEILWLSEAAHVPVIWATQVLDSLAKSGLPSRAEITDAAMGSRAECVMLNKGPHITSAIKVLDNILQRMEEHVTKKSALLRQLRWWERSHSHCITPPADS